MYPDYERYWMAVLADPNGPLPLIGKPATKNDIRWNDESTSLGFGTIGVLL